MGPDDNNSFGSAYNNTIVWPSCSGSSHEGIHVDYVYAGGIGNNLIVNVGGPAIKVQSGAVGNLTVSHNIRSSNCGTNSNFAFSANAISAKEVLFCNGEEGTDKYSLRVDAEAASANNGWGELVGIHEVECAWGTLARSSSYGGTTEYNHTLKVLKDLIIPSGLALNLLPGATVSLDDFDDSGLGNDVEKVELTVLSGGTLNVGLSGQVVFTSSQPTPQEGDWWGIDVQYGGLATIKNATIQDAEYGVVYGSATAGEIASCYFLSNSIYDMVLGAGGGTMLATVHDNLIAVGGGTGIELETSAVGGATIGPNNQIIGDQSLSLNGVKFGPSSDNQPTLITENFIQSFMSGTGISTPPGAPVIKKNTLEFCGTGIYCSLGTPIIGLYNDSSSDNIIHWDWVGVKVDGGTPKIRNNQIIDNKNTGVQVRYSGNPNLGDLTEDGKNTFTGYSVYTRCIDNLNGSVIVSARGNYFENGGPASCTNGNVDTGNYLQAPPASGDAPVGALPDVPLRPIVYGVSPNPLPGAGKILFSVPVDAAEVRIRIYDLAGRLVRDFGGGSAARGLNSVVWEGSDDLGRQTPNGIYFIRLTVNDRDAGAAKALVSR